MYGENKCAPECDCVIGGECTSNACCYYGGIIPTNAHSELNPGLPSLTREQRLYAALVEIERLSPKAGGIGQIARDVLRAYNSKTV